jgi:hypothetical protein
MKQWIVLIRCDCMLENYPVFVDHKGCKRRGDLHVGRLFVSDGQSPKVVSIDLDSGIEVYAMPDSAISGFNNTPAVYPSSDAQHIYINYRAQGVVRIIKIGITLDSHGDSNQAFCC